MGTSVILGDVVRDLHKELGRRYVLHHLRVRERWRSLGKTQRIEVFRAGAADGAVLKHPQDHTLGTACLLIPEWNELHITNPDSDHLLTLIEHRASKTLNEQYARGIGDNFLGDRDLITVMMQQRGLAHTSTFENCYSTFFNDETYGKGYEIMSPEIIAEFQALTAAGSCVRQDVGELILTRQQYLLQGMCVIIDDILDLDASTSSRSTRLVKRKILPPSPPGLNSEIRRTQVALPDLIETSMDQEGAMSDELGLLFRDPQFLAHAVHTWFFSRPELLPDEKGRVAPVQLAKYISPMIFERVMITAEISAYWTYVTRLLTSLDGEEQQYRKAIFAQELCRSCHWGYRQMQNRLQRHVQQGIGKNHFRRLSIPVDRDGQTRVKLKVPPESFTRSDPQIHYLLRLCQTDLKPAAAMEWVDRLEALLQSHPDEQQRLNENEHDALDDLKVIICFIQDVSKSKAVPDPGRKGEAVFIGRLRSLRNELRPIQHGIDLLDYALPIDNLQKFESAQSALRDMETAIRDSKGGGFKLIYQNLLEDCFADLERFLQLAVTVEDRTSALSEISSKTDCGGTDDIHPRTEKHKVKTRPASTLTDERPQRQEVQDAVEGPATSPTLRGQCSETTMAVMSVLFRKSESRGSVSWAAFEAAMADLGFSIIPKYGSAFTFRPPKHMGASRSFMLHRPHHSSIEGWRVLRFASRLNRLYGWDASTFEAL